MRERIILMIKHGPDCLEVVHLRFSKDFVLWLREPAWPNSKSMVWCTSDIMGLFDRNMFPVHDALLYDAILTKSAQF